MPSKNYKYSPGCQKRKKKILMESGKKSLKGSIERHFVMTSKDKIETKDKNDKMVTEDNGVSSHSSLSATFEEK